jgi:hypothetical protein
MTPKQLPLTPRPSIDPFPERLRDPVYLGFAFGPKDKPADIAVDVVRTFTTRKGYRPREIQCHPSVVEVIEKEVGGIPVIGCGRAVRVLLLGPLES